MLAAPEAIGELKEDAVLGFNRRGSLTTVLLAALLVAVSTGASTARAAEVPGVDALLKRLGFQEEDKTALLQGKVIGTDLKRTRDDQIVVAMAVKLDVPLSEVTERVSRGRNIEVDSATIAFGKLDPKGDAEQFAKARYDKHDGNEIKMLINLEADGNFNLSKAELDALKKAVKGLRPTAADAGDKVSAAYQKVLAGRFQAYVDKGLTGVADYQAGARLSPAKQLQAAYDQGKPFLDEYFPAFSQALGQYPNGQSPDISSSFYWVKRDVEDRPDFVLAHQMVQSGDGFLLLSQRQFFVGHTYESLQVIALAVPLEKSVVVFYANSAFTDKITGIFSGVAESVGQKRTKEDLEKYFEAIKKRER